MGHRFMTERERVADVQLREILQTIRKVLTGHYNTAKVCNQQTPSGSTSALSFPLPVRSASANPNPRKESP